MGGLGFSLLLWSFFIVALETIWVKYLSETYSSFLFFPALQLIPCGPFGAYGGLSRKCGCFYFSRAFRCWPCLPLEINTVQEIFQFYQPVSKTLADIFWKKVEDNMHFTTIRHFLISLFSSALARTFHLPSLSDFL